MKKKFFSLPTTGGETVKYLKGVFSNFDTRIIFLFSALILISIIVFLFKYNNYLDCESTDFYINSTNNAVGEALEFSDETYNAQEWLWDFGDGSPHEYRKQALHIYDEPGIYTVKLTLNGFCVKEKRIEIKYYGKLVDSTKIPKIIAPKIAFVGDVVRFGYEYSRESYSWQWSFGETARPDAVTQRPYYIYETPGMKTVSLMINGDVDHMATKNIYIKPTEIVNPLGEYEIKGYVYERPIEEFKLPPGDPQKDPLDELLEKAPVAPTPTKKKQESNNSLPGIAPNISEDQFELMLMQVSKKEKTKEDFAQYLCGNYEISVIKNDQLLITFSQLCRSIRGEKIRIESLRLTKDNLNCVVGISISYKVKKFLQWMKD